MSQKNRESFNEGSSTENQAAMWERLARLEAELADNKNQISTLRQQLSQAQQQLRTGNTLPVQAVEATSRRRALKRLAAGAAGLGALSIAAQASFPMIANAETASDTALEAAAGSAGYGGKFSSDYAQLYMPLAAGAVNNATYNFAGHNRGELLVDSAGDLYFLVATTGTTANKWRKLAGPKTSGTLHLLSTPSRFIDTRSPNINDPGGAYGNAVARTYTITSLTGTGGGTIPAGAAGIVGNLTVVPSAGSGGYLQVGPSTPTINVDPSAINWNPGVVVANNFTAALNSTGQLVVQAVIYSPTGNSVNIILDINGYYL